MKPLSTVGEALLTLPCTPEPVHVGARRVGVTADGDALDCPRHPEQPGPQHPAGVGGARTGREQDHLWGDAQYAALLKEFARCESMAYRAERAGTAARDRIGSAAAGAEPSAVFFDPDVDRAPIRVTGEADFGTEHAR